GWKALAARWRWSRWRRAACACAPRSRRAPPDVAGDRIRIALCDDQALVLRGLSALLADAGIEIAIEATAAEPLLEALSRRPVDVVVSDIRMPGIGGIGL